MTCLEFHPTKNNILLSGDKVSLTLCISSYTWSGLGKIVILSNALICSLFFLGSTVKERTSWSLGF